MLKQTSSTAPVRFGSLGRASSGVVPYVFISLLPAKGEKLWYKIQTINKLSCITISIMEMDYENEFVNWLNLTDKRSPINFSHN